MLDLIYQRKIWSWVLDFIVNDQTEKENIICYMKEHLLDFNQVYIEDFNVD